MASLNSPNSLHLDHNAIRNDASKGDATAQFLLGWMYCKGKGLPQDYHQAITWYEKAGEQGNVRALSSLRVMYLEGLGVDVNISKVAYWALKGAQAGDLECQAHLVSLYLGGKGVSRDPIRAYAWSLIARDNGDYWRNSISRLLLKLSLTERQIKEAEQYAEEWQKNKTGKLAEAASPLKV